jgi:hypothetical protein
VLLVLSYLHITPADRGALAHAAISRPIVVTACMLGSSES